MTKDNNKCNDSTEIIADKTFKYLDKNKFQARKLVNALSESLIYISRGIAVGLAACGILGAIFMVWYFLEKMK